MIRHQQLSTLFPYTTLFRSASYTGDADSRHVNGWVKKLGNTSFIFPVGNNTYERTVAVNNLSVSSELDCRYRSRSEEHTSELQSRRDLVCRLLLEKKKKNFL